MATYVGDALLAHAAGGCYICQRGDSLVDTDAVIVGEGVLAVCKGCISDLAQAAGLHLNSAAVAEREAAFIEERRQFAPERVSALEAELTETKAALDAALKVDELLDDIRKAAKGPQVNRRPSR